VASAVGLKGEASAGYNNSYSRSNTSNDSNSSSSNRDKSLSVTGGVSRDHATGATVSTNDGTFSQSGQFSRSQQSESRTKAIEESLSRIESYNEQARHYRELSQSLEQHASFAESSGFNLTQDLSQDLARYYDKEVANAPSGVLPGLWETNLSSTQEGMRNAAIGKWADQRSEAIERDIQSALSNPALEGIELPGVASEASVVGRYSGGSGLPSPRPVASSKPSTAQEDGIVTAGAADLLGEKHRRDMDARVSLANGPAGPDR
jgi:conjugal transfer mating pair stabilization protein TraG